VKKVLTLLTLGVEELHKYIPFGVPMKNSFYFEAKKIINKKIFAIIRYSQSK